MIYHQPSKLRGTHCVPSAEQRKWYTWFITSPANQVGHMIYHQPSKASGTHDLSPAQQTKWNTWFTTSPVNLVAHMIYHQPSKPSGTHDLSPAQQTKWDTWFIMSPPNQVEHMTYHQPSKPRGTHDWSSSRQIKWVTWFLFIQADQVGHMIDQNPRIFMYGPWIIFYGLLALSWEFSFLHSFSSGGWATIASFAFLTELCFGRSWIGYSMEIILVVTVLDIIMLPPPSPLLLSVPLL